MRVRRALLIVGLVVAGAVVARPDDVMPLASRLFGPLVEQNGGVRTDAAAVLPAFVPQHHGPSFAGSQDSGSGAPSVIDTAQAATLGNASNMRLPSDAVALAPPVASDVPTSNSGAPVTAGTEPAKPADEATTRPIPGGEAPVSALPPTPGDGEAANNSDALPAATGPEAAIVPPPGAPIQGGAAETSPPGNPGAAGTGQPPPVVAAKVFFGAAKTPSPLAARAIGSYARGCLAGAVALPVDGPAWQAMRLSRNRNWGHPNLIALVEKLATDAQQKDGWPGLLVGDLAQPRGGPMVSGHASHQVGLDADVWLTPMPDHKLSNKEREDISATSMLDKTELAVDPNIFNADRVKLIKRAASYPEVERVLVHPAIKKALCLAAGTDRKWLTKVRPYYGHYYHFHIRISCPPNSPNCVPQVPPPGDDGCGKEVDDWLARLAIPPKPPVPGAKPAPPAPGITLAQLPAECRTVLASGPDGITAPPDRKPVVKTAARRTAWQARTYRHGRRY